MENASKAVIMVGSVFIAIAVMSVALYFYTEARGYAGQSEEILSATQIQSFNKFYTAYQTSDNKIRGIDALNILNRAREDEVSVSAIPESGQITFNGTNYEIEDSLYYLGSSFIYQTHDNDRDGKIDAVSISDIT